MTSDAILRIISRISICGGWKLELPFFDGEFLESILTSDVDAFLMHRFYNRWLAHFPKPTRAVAWQAYPGHEPGPLDAGADLRNQWVNLYDTQQERQQRRQNS